MKFGSRLVHLVARLTKKSLFKLVEGLKSYQSSFSAVFRDPEKSLFKSILSTLSRFLTVFRKVKTGGWF